MLCAAVAASVYAWEWMKAAKTVDEEMFSPSDRSLEHKKLENPWP
jgi:hypothetical protein